ncbi:MAG TPA: glycolate oxidase subunit GlcF [Chromatiales bacterium]|nr:glycolate oxidase subunit GlcF [Chromatiales bacterium]
MQTNLTQAMRNSREGIEAENILRKCVHCGFCTATCPTYQVLGDELDGPRGRIYLIKQVLEGVEPGTDTQQHLDRCLTCRNCETTCPSGVEYGRLLDIGRQMVDQRVQRPASQRLARLVLRKVLASATVFTPLLRIGQLFRPLLPPMLKQKIPPHQAQRAWPNSQHPRRMLVLDGCVQPGLAPSTNTAAARILDRLGIRLLRIRESGCCGSLSQHLSAPDEALDFARANIDAWWPHIETGAEAIVITASGCGVFVKEYGQLLALDPDYADKAATVSRLTRDIAEILSDEDLSSLPRPSARRVAWHPPCTLQHGQKVVGNVESILGAMGLTLTTVENSHLCCGSAGVYSVLHPEMGQTLGQNKLAALESDQPDVIVTANIGCQMHLSQNASQPVRHWIELLADGIG